MVRYSKQTSEASTITAPFDDYLDCLGNGRDSLIPSWTNVTSVYCTSVIMSLICRVLSVCSVNTRAKHGWRGIDRVDIFYSHGACFLGSSLHPCMDRDTCLLKRVMACGQDEFEVAHIFVRFIHWRDATAMALINSEKGSLLGNTVVAGGYSSAG